MSFSEGSVCPCDAAVAHVCALEASKVIEPGTVEGGIIVNVAGVAFKAEDDVFATDIGPVGEVFGFLGVEGIEESDERTKCGIVALLENFAVQVQERLAFFAGAVVVVLIVKAYHVASVITEKAGLDAGRALGGQGRDRKGDRRVFAVFAQLINLNEPAVV